jgi:ribonuclease HI
MTGADMQTEKRIKAETRVIELYTDGGVIEKNPSPIGGTWAWIIVENGVQICSESGAISAAEMRMEDLVTNNQTELLALLYGLDHLPADFAGTVLSDSNNSLGRLFSGWKWNNIPPWMHARYQLARKRLANWDQIAHVLLDGHPTKAQLAAGIGKRGHPVSIYNVQCDKLCGEAAEKFLRNHCQVEPQSPVPKPDDELRPAINTALFGQGVVIGHERITDSLGHYYGLNKLVIQGAKRYPDVELWKGMLPKGAVVARVEFDNEKLFKSSFYYKVIQP